MLLFLEILVAIILLPLALGMICAIISGISEAIKDYRECKILRRKAKEHEIWSRTP